MSGQRIIVHIYVRTRWWVRWYIAGVRLTAYLTGLKPDMEKVGRCVDRGMRVYVEEVRR